MIENKTVIGGLIVSIVALMAFAFAMSVADDLSGEPLAPTYVFTWHKARGPEISTVVDTAGSAYGKVDVQYPHLRGRHADALNAIIEKDMREAKSDFLKTAEESWKARIETAGPGERYPAAPVTEDAKAFLITSWSLAQLNSRIVSIKIATSEYTFGAHPSEAITTYNFDVNTGKMLTLADVFAGDPDYLNKVSKASIADLSEKFGKNVMFDLTAVKSGASPDAKNFASFTTDGHMVTIYFQTYQVGSRPFGQPTVELPILSQ